VESYSLRQTGNQIKHVHFDLGGEFINGAFHAYLKEKGIRITWAPARTPDLNGVAERKNRTHMEKALCAMHESSLAPKYWGELFLAAVYITNRLYTSANPDFKTPFERFEGYKPPVSHLRRL
jgi:transposase InsO family protein